MRLPESVKRSAYPWVLLIGTVALSAFANALHAPDGSDWWAYGLSAVPPLSAAFAWHLLVLPAFAGGGWQVTGRRWAARLGSAAVFGYSLVGSWESLTALGERAGMAHPTVLPVSIDGLAFVAALAVWARIEGGATTAAETVPATPPQTTEPPAETPPAEAPAETPSAAVDPEPERVPTAAQLDAMFRLPAGTVETIRERADSERADAAAVLAAQRAAVLDRVPAVVPAPAPAPEGAPAPTDEGAPAPAPEGAPEGAPAPTDEGAPAPAPEGAPAPRPRRHRAGTRGGTGPGTRTDVPAKVRRHWERERGAGRTPTGPELARIAGVGETRGKQYRRALEAEGAGTVTPIGAARA